MTDDKASGCHSAETVLASGQVERQYTAEQTLGRLVLRNPKELHMHRILQDVGCASEGGLETLRQPISPPLLVTTDGTILTGILQWQLAVAQKSPELTCIEYQMSDEESLQFILNHYRSRRNWNAFLRIRVALRLKPYFQQRALNNMSAGGRWKGSAKLPDLNQIDVRHEIANSAGVGDRNVSNVEMILEKAHPRLIEALQGGGLTINHAVQLCKLPKTDQLKQFVQDCERSEIDKVIRRSIKLPKGQKEELSLVPILAALQRSAEENPGSVLLRTAEIDQSMILLGRDLVSKATSQMYLVSA